MSTQIYFVPRQTEKRKAFLEWKSIDLFSKVSLKCRGNISYKSVHHPIPTRGNKEHPSKFQNKSCSKLSFQLNVQVYSLLGQTEGEGKSFFGGFKKGKVTNYEITPQENLVSFCEN